MRPVFFEFSLPGIGAVAFPAYMVMLLVGATAAIVFARRQAFSMGLDGERMFGLGLVLLATGIAGARLLSVLTDGQLSSYVNLCFAPDKVPALNARVAHCTASVQCGYDYVCDTARHVCHPPRDCFAALKFWWGGLTYYGGFVLAAPTGVWYARRHELDVATTADVVAPAMMIALFFGRIGCFFNGCCYGAATDGPTGVQFPGHPGPVHPTQLYEAVVVAAIFALLHWLVRPRARKRGDVFAALLVLYGVARFILEFWRADPRGSLGPLSTSQLLSIPLIALGIWLMTRPASKPQLL